MILVLRCRETIPPPCWTPLQDGDKRSASMICPNGHYATLLDHEIYQDGSVVPSVMCPPENNCGFHDTVRLVGWGDPPPDSPIPSGTPRP